MTPLLQPFKLESNSDGRYDQSAVIKSVWHQWKKWWGTSINVSAVFMEMLQSIWAM